MCVFGYVCEVVFMSECVCVYVFVYVCKVVYVSECVCVFVHVCEVVYVFLCMFVKLFMCAWVCVHSYTPVWSGEVKFAGKVQIKSVCITTAVYLSRPLGCVCVCVYVCVCMRK